MDLLRKKQIDTLKVFNDNVTEILENQEYTVGFGCGLIKVIIGPNFPNEKPVMFVSPVWRHPWIHMSSGQIMNAPGLLNYSINSDLGRVILAVIRELERNGPGDNPEVTQPQFNEPPLANSVAFPELSNLSLDMLEELNSKEDVLRDFVEELEPVRTLTAELDKLMADVEVLAKANLNHNTDLSAKRSALQELIQEFKALGEVYNIESHEYKRKCEEFEPEHIKELLQIAASVSDSECEQEVDKFLQGETDVNTFLNLYLQTKKLSALRKTKQERLGQQLKDMEKANLS